MDPNELPALLAAERISSREEGRQTDADLDQQVDAWLAQVHEVHAASVPGQSLTPDLAAAGEKLYVRLQAAPLRPDYPYREPQEWDQIVAACPGLAQPHPPSRVQGGGGQPRDSLDRILGGWLGRAAGCLLGKPVEGWPRARIERLLAALDQSELSAYLPAALARGGPSGPIGEDEDEELALHCPSTWLQGSIQGMVRDDDLDYTVVALRVLESHGFRFAPAQVGDFWLNHLPYYQVYTAERAAYRNWVDGFRPPQTAWRFNPYREWIGAQIRADLYGYVCPGRPEEAARLAYQDATLSHTGNGVYGAMWVAATVAATAVSSSVRQALAIGQQYIPAQSRLAEMLGECTAWQQAGLTWDQAWQRLNERYGQYHPVHTINNAGVVALALLYGQEDFGRTVGLAVRGGWDTDCNGATAGSILGAWLGAAQLPAEWVRPLADRLQTSLADEGELRFTELAARTVRLVPA